MERLGTSKSITYPSKENESLDEYLDSYRPSTKGLFECGWIGVTNPRDGFAASGDIRGLQSAWKDSCAEGRASSDELRRLSVQFGVLGGKWSLYVSREQVDDIWDGIARATHEGTLGTQAKVAPFDEFTGPGLHRLCVYTRDVTDFWDVQRVRDALRALGVQSRIAYKPLAYTYCGIYENNPWCISPTILWQNLIS
ncbi:hypothetical protein H0H93_002269 [Arthromyces matolae]|nr:hypothetical protein H0H93_002269 [Arthromyces matolae]